MKSIWGFMKRHPTFMAKWCIFGCLVTAITNAFVTLSKNIQQLDSLQNLDRVTSAIHYTDSARKKAYPDKRLRYSGGGSGVLTPIGQLALARGLHELRIYVYPLPERFNNELITCATTKRKSLCFDFKNDGFGENLWTAEGISIHQTHQFASEVIFHRQILDSPYLTDNITQADLVYMPFYAGLACFCGDASTRVQEFWELFLARNATVWRDKHHFMALAKIEQTDSEKSRKYFHRWGKESELVLIPYPTFIHHGYSSEDKEIQANWMSSFNRTITALLVGSPKKSDLRRILAMQLQNSSQGLYLKTGTTECSLRRGNTPVKIVELMTKSVFCLQPPGDTPTRKSFFDSIESGCIPVIFMQDVLYPFQEFIDYRKFTVYIDMESVLVRNENVVDILKEIPRSVVTDMQKSLLQVAPYFQYPPHHTPHNAFTMTLRALSARLGVTY